MSGSTDRREALGALVEANYGLMAHIARGILREDPSRIEDAIQDALLSAVEHDAGLTGDEFARWISVLVRNAALNVAIKQGRGVLRLVAQGEDPEAVAVASDGYDPEDARMEVVGAMAKLSERHRTVLSLYYLEGLSAEKAAEKSGLRRGEFGRCLDAARKALGLAMGRKPLPFNGKREAALKGMVGRASARKEVG